MSAKLMAAGFPNFAEVSPWAKSIRNIWRWLLPRVSPAARAGGRALAVEERVAIGPRKALVLVRCHDKQLLVAIAGDTVGPIIEIASRKPARRSRKERES